MRKRKAVFVLLIIIFLLTCARTPLRETVLYEGSIYDYKRSDNLVEWFEGVKLCMNITENVPMLQIRVYEDNPQMCENLEQDRCHKSGTIMLSENMQPKVIKHQMVHYLLWAIIGDSDNEHIADYFRKCT